MVGDRDYLVLAEMEGIFDYWWLETEKEMREQIDDVRAFGGRITFAGKIHTSEDFTDEFTEID